MKKKPKKKADFSPARKQKMLKIIAELQKKMLEIDRLKKDIEYKHISFASTPKQTKALIEEIRVPALELIKDESAKRK